MTGHQGIRAGLTLGLLAVAVAACGGGGGGGGSPDGGGNPPPGGGGDVMVGDDARRAVLADIADDIILPALRDFDAEAQALSGAMATFAAAPADADALAQAQDAWQQAVEVFERVEVLQVGPAARMTDSDPQPAAEDLRDQIYAYPDRVLFQIDCRALSGAGVDADTRIDAKGLGALEHLLFNDAVADALNNENCTDGTVDVEAARATYASRIADFIAETATELRNRWEPGQGDFRGQFANAGDGSMVYGRPQDALNALSLALFYVEKQTKDRKVACPVGIEATGFEGQCRNPDPTLVEFPFAAVSTPALRANVAVFGAVFAGVGDGMGINDLLRGMDDDSPGMGSEIAEDMDTAVAAALATIDEVADRGGLEAVIGGFGNDECNNAAAAGVNTDSPTVEPIACFLQGRLKAVIDVFRAEVVANLQLAVPQDAAGDND